jgi:phytoene dehydrogenase-like protein
MGSIEFCNHDIRMDIEVRDSVDRYGSKIFHLYTNLDKLSTYLLDLSPGDVRAIRKLIRSMRKIQGYEYPPMIKSVPELLPFVKKILFIRYFPELFFVMKWRKKTNVNFAEKLRDPFLKEVFMLLFDGDEMPLLILTMPLAFNDKSGVGYPIGGSLKFAKKIEEKYLRLGGRIRYNAGVDEIQAVNGKATGIKLADGSLVHSDVIVSAADWHDTVFHLLKGKYVNKKILELQNQHKLQVFYSVFLLSLGMSRSFSEQPYLFRFPIGRDLISPDGTIYYRMEVHFHNYDPTLAPAGKSIVSVKYYTMNGEYWINLRNSDQEEYKKQKSRFADEIISIMEEKFGGIREAIEETDIATPATYHRYTNNWKGSSQGWLPGKNLIAPSPVEPVFPGLRNLYLAGHWLQPGGGLPVAIKSARTVAQIICHRSKIPFTVR